MRRSGVLNINVKVAHGIYFFTPSPNFGHSWNVQVFQLDTFQGFMSCYYLFSLRMIFSLLRGNPYKCDVNLEPKMDLSLKLMVLLLQIV